MRHTARRQVLVAVLVVGSLAFGGCLTLAPTVTPETTNSTVFESVSASESWSSQRVRTTVRLASNPAAGDVNQITVIGENNKTFSLRNLAPGQTKVIIQLPVNQNATLVASDTVNGTTIATLNVTTRGNEIV
jgi:hypothetical protein